MGQPCGSGCIGMEIVSYSLTTMALREMTLTPRQLHRVHCAYCHVSHHNLVFLPRNKVRSITSAVTTANLTNVVGK